MKLCSLGNFFSPTTRRGKRGSSSSSKKKKVEGGVKSWSNLASLPPLDTRFFFFFVSFSGLQFYKLDSRFTCANANITQLTYFTLMTRYSRATLFFLLLHPQASWPAWDTRPGKDSCFFLYLLLPLLQQLLFFSLLFSSSSFSPSPCALYNSIAKVHHTQTYVHRVVQYKPPLNCQICPITVNDH